MKYPKITVNWLDSRQPTGNWVWLSDYEFQGVCKVKSTGFLVHETDDYLALAVSISEDEDDCMASGITYIPKSYVTKRR